MKRNEVLTEKKRDHKLMGWKSNVFVRVLLFLVLLLLFYVAISNKLVPKTYHIQVNTTSEQTILSPKQVVNTTETQKAKAAAAAQVQTVYRFVPMNSDPLIDQLFDTVRKNNALTDKDMTPDEKASLYRNVFPAMMQDYIQQLVDGFANDGQYNENLVAEMKQILNEQQYKIPEQTYFQLVRVSQDDLNAMEQVTKDIVHTFVSDQIVDASTARAKVTALVNASDLTKSVSRQVVAELADFVLTANNFKDTQSTDEAKAKAAENTKTIFINKNDVLVKKGQLITENTYNLLKSLNLLKDHASNSQQIGVVLLASLFTLVVYLFTRQSKLVINKNNGQLAMLVTIFLLNILIMNIVALSMNLSYPYVGFIAPVALGSMLVMILLDAQLAWISTLLFAVFASMIFNTNEGQIFDFRYGFVALVACIASLFFINRASQRMTILRAGLINSGFAMVAVSILFLLDVHHTSKDVVFALSFAAAGGILTTILVIGLMPFFETVFKILSPLKLIELSNPNHVLLRKLLTETPGTYHHSVMVGNLSEACAEAIGADGLLCRVGAYYHDVGKTRRPSYFIENQSHMDNPHDRIDPALSKSIIIAHVSDGMEMLQEYKIPKAICDIAEQHHGTTLLQYFYHKALQKMEEASGSEVSEDEYRYPGPKAQTKEAAIVGISDCVEAAVRSLRSPTMEQIDAMVEKIIKQRLNDGQFDDCDLTLKDLGKISQALRETLLGIFHSRIEYPHDLPHKEA